MVTVGILIAIGLEHAVEAWHHHELGVEARQNILAEIRDNKKEVERARAQLQRNREKLKRTLDTVRKILASEKLEEAHTPVIVNGATLASTSWNAAAATGTVAYMGYDEVKRFATAYEMHGHPEAHGRRTIACGSGTVRDPRLRWRSTKTRPGPTPPRGAGRSESSRGNDGLGAGCP